MKIEQIFKDPTLQAKEKTERLTQLIVNKDVTVDEMIAYGLKSKPHIKATCIECMEFATKAEPHVMTQNTLALIIGCLSDKAPRVKWESARVIGNTIHLFPALADEAVNKLLPNTEVNGTVVRWSAAYALSQILKLKLTVNADLIPAVEAIINHEEKNSIQKIYKEGLKKAK